MLRWQEPLFLGAGVEDEKGLKRKVDRGKAVIGYYLLTASDSQGNLLEIYPCSLLFQKELRKRLPLIVGVAKGKEEAMDLAAKVLMEHDCFLPRA